MSETTAADDAALQKSFPRVRRVFGALNEDRQNITSKFHRAAVWTTGAGVALHQTGGMEWLLSNAGGGVYEATHNPLEAGGAMALTSLAVETTLSAGISFNSKHLRKTAKVFVDLKQAKPVEALEADASRWARMRKTGEKALLAVNLGTPGVLALDFGQNPDKSPMQRFKSGVKTATYLASFNLGLGAAATGGMEFARANDMPQVGEYALPVLESPLTWGSLFAVALGGRAISNYRARRQAAAQEAVE